MIAVSQLLNAAVNPLNHQQQYRTKKAILVISDRNDSPFASSNIFVKVCKQSHSSPPVSLNPPDAFYDHTNRKAWLIIMFSFLIK